jgi:hypothetical protein
VLSENMATKKKRLTESKYSVGDSVEWSINVNGLVAFTVSGRVEEVLDNHQYVVSSHNGAKYRVCERVDGSLGAGD